MPKVTIRDVAEAAGVGIGTVSRVLNNNENVSDKTRQRVIDVIEELNFVPNAAARQLPRKTPYQSIGVITRPFDEYFSFAERLRGVQKALKPYVDRYELTLHNTHTTRNYDQRLLSIIETSVIAGLLLIDFELTADQKVALGQLGIPFVGLNHARSADWVCIGTDNEQGGYLATRYLIRLGHTKIAYLGNDLIDEDGFETSKGRYTGYLRALQDAGIQQRPAYFQAGVAGYDAAKAMSLTLLRQRERPTAIFAMSDIQGLGAIAAAKELDLRVPEDVSVIGYDDIEVAFHTGLTTVRQHLETSGTVAMNYLLQMIHHEAPDEIPRLPPLEIIERETTRHL
ncbi:MAG: LacI family DNA-binding transcriptional regulator [Chloroflexota bacterium]